MSDAPERIWDFWPDDGGAPIVWRDPCPFPADDAEVVEYTRSDMLPAMLAKAHAEVRAQGLQEAQDAEWNDAIHAAIHAVRGLDFEYTEPVLLALRDLLRKENDR